MEITFFPKEIWSFDRESILLAAKVDGKSVVCVVPQEFLTTPYTRTLEEEEARELFLRRRSEIESLLSEQIRKGAYDSSGEIILHRWGSGSR
jgi:hypothetical protein